MAINCRSSILVGLLPALLLLSACTPPSAQAPSQATPRETPTIVPHSFSLIEGDHFLSQVDSNNPGEGTLSMEGIPGNKYVVYAMCDEGNTLSFHADGIGEIDREPFIAQCLGIVNRHTVVFEPDEVDYELLTVEFSGPGEWAVALAWQDQNGTVQVPEG